MLVLFFVVVNLMCEAALMFHGIIKRHTMQDMECHKEKKESSGFPLPSSALLSFATVFSSNIAMN